jgi:hypothetical protein
MQATTTPQPPPPPALPPLPPLSPRPAEAPIAGATPQAARPLSEREIRSIRDRREELSNQLQSAEGRRNRLSQRLENAEGADRAGIEQRIRLLDERILQIEADIAATGRLLTSAPTGTPITAQAAQFGPFDSEAAGAIGGLFTIFVLAPLAFAYARRLWRRPVPAAGLSPESAQRFDRLEQAVDAIAIEVERISEGQRYVTRLLSEAQGVPALGAGRAPAEPIRLPDRERVRVGGDAT